MAFSKRTGGRGTAQRSVFLRCQITPVLPSMRPPLVGSRALSVHKIKEIAGCICPTEAPQQVIGGTGQILILETHTRIHRYTHKTRACMSTNFKPLTFHANPVCALFLLILLLFFYLPDWTLVGFSSRVPYSNWTSITCGSIRQVN